MHVILATGLWTSRLIDITSSAISTAQPVGFFQITADEADRSRKTSIAIDLDRGFFVFPPMLGSNILKCARHGSAYETRVSMTTPASSDRPQLQGFMATVLGPCPCPGYRSLASGRIVAFLPSRHQSQRDPPSDWRRRTVIIPVIRLWSRLHGV